LIAQLQSGDHVTVFPEGTTTAGDRVLPFHAALFQSAIDARTPVVPLALRYCDTEGRSSRAPAYDGDVTLLQCLLSIVRAGGLVAEVRILAPLGSAQADRRHLSARCHHAIAWQLGHAGPDVPTPSPSAGPTGHRASGIPGDPQAASL
jgi:1-acyl-sn-glycerol-3-phosphate acyltransferase